MSEFKTHCAVSFMTKTAACLAICFAILLACPLAQSQAVNAAQRVTLAGLRTSNGHGSFPAAAYGADGSLFLLYDQSDGVRVLKLNAAGTALLAQAQLGAGGDLPLALALDPSGNVFVTGTSTSGSLSGSTGSAFPSRADTSINSFLARFDANLNLVFVTFLGAGHTAVAGVAATADAVFVTGLTFNLAFPVTAGGIQQTPAVGTTENGFVERFSTDGANLVYATYLTGANGVTAPSAIVADATDNAYIAGYTSATGFPTLAALVPETLGSASGFLTKLTPQGDGLIFSTFIPGSGITGLALDIPNQTLLLSGGIALGQFPIATALVPLATVPYQSLLKIPTSGQAVSASTLLVPGSQSTVSAGLSGDAWVTGSLSTPLFPGTSQPLSPIGDSFALHITSANVIDQTLRFGGKPAGLFANATISTVAAAPAVSPDATTIAFPATLSVSVSPSLATSQRFDLATVQTPNALVPNSIRDLAAVCTGTSQCFLTAGLLNLVSTSASAPSVSISADNAPNIIVRNLGSNAAAGLVLVATASTLSSNCSPVLDPSNSCSVVLTPAAAQTFTVSAANAPTESASIAATSALPTALAVGPVELDFGIQTSASPATMRTLTVTNLSAATQTFVSALDTVAHTLPYTLAEFSSDCPTNNAGTKTLAPAAVCHITLALTASTIATNDATFRAAWKIATTDIALTGVTQAAALNLSANEIDFGTQFANGLRLPRFLHLSNNSAAPVAHTIVTLPSGSPFSVQDECPSILQPHTVCRLSLTYSSPKAPSADSTELTLDQSLTVLVTGITLPQQGTTGSTANPSLAVTPSTISFASPVVVTGLSSTTQTVVVKNTSINTIPLTLSVSGDFTLQNGCPANLLGGSSCQLLVTFAPAQPGARQGLIAIAGGGGFAPAYVSLAGTASSILPANNGTLDLGQTQVGTPVVVWLKVPQTLTSLTVASSSPAFTLALVADQGYGPGTPPPASFAATASGLCVNCYIGIQFLSQTPGLQGATLSLSTVANGSAYTLALTGTALPVSGLLLSPTTQDFGPVAVNSSSGPHLFTLANLVTPSASVAITSAIATGDFTLVSNTSGGQTCSVSLAPTASCFIGVVFAPSASGLRTGTLTLTTSAGIVTTTLTGDGLADPGVAINPTDITFRNVLGIAATQQSIVLSNTGTATLSIGPITSSDSAFTASSICSTLAHGTTCAITVTFQPGSAYASGTLTIPVTSTINGQTSTALYVVPLSGLYTIQDAGLQILPAQINFGTTNVGAVGVTRLLTLNNLTAKPVAVSLSLPRQFPVATTGACLSLAPFGTCSFAVLYVPSTGGAATGTIVATGTPNDGSPALQALGYMQGFGSAAGVLTITGNIVPHAALNFGTANSGQSSQQTLALTNSGSGALNVRRITSQPPFLSTTTCGATLTPGQSCSVVITYSPIDQVVVGTSPLPRADAGTLVIESDAASSPDTIDLAGSVSPSIASAAGNGALLSSFSLSQGALTFASTGVGNASAAQTLSLTNVGSSTLHVFDSTASTDFTVTSNCATLLPGEVCALMVSFQPTAASTSSTRTGTLGIRTDASTALDFVTLIGTSAAAPLTLTPAALDFGTLNVGTNGALDVTVINTSAAPIVFSGLTASGDFSAAFGTCPVAGAALAANSSCILRVTFTPTVAGVRTGTLGVSTLATTLPLTVMLTGNAIIASLQITPGALDFGTVAVTSPSNLTTTLLNVGSAPVLNIGATITGANAADFAITSPCSITSLAPSQGCAMTVTFRPSVAGPRSATLRVASSDPSSPSVIPLTGSGVAFGSFLLTVNGGSSASATVKTGFPAIYTLAVTPINGFTGTVALTCAAITAGTYATCSLNPSTVNLSGSAQASIVTINTITSASLERIGLHARATTFFALLGLPLLWTRSFRRLRRIVPLLILTAMIGTSLVGCGSGVAGYRSTLRYTPAGAYQYQVTAVSTSGVAVTQTVTLNLIVQ